MGSTLHAGHHLAHLAAGDFLHHLARLVELLQQAVHFLQSGAATASYALAARAVQYLGMGALFGRHGVDDGFDAHRVSCWPVL